MSSSPADTEARHILSLSGGKDSTALAVFMKREYPEIPLEYVFMDTGEELPETYAYLEKIETYLGKRITRLLPDKTWDQYLEQFSGYLPSPANRWCTIRMKIKPYEKFVGESHVVSYIGIRADEDREGYISSKPNITARYPFREHGIDKEGVMKILDEAGLGLPAYYQWRSRSGCYFCFFQRRYEWVGLKNKHPELFERAAQFETRNADGSEQQFTWYSGTTLRDYVADEEAIHRRHQAHMERAHQKKRETSSLLLDVFHDSIQSDEDAREQMFDDSCDVCHV